MLKSDEVIIKKLKYESLIIIMWLELLFYVANKLQTVFKEEQRKRGKLESDLTLLRSAYEKDVKEKDAEIKMLQSDNDQIKKQIIKLTRFDSSSLC